MFKTTTVSVDGEKGEDSMDGMPMTVDTNTEVIEDKGICSVSGQGSPRTGPAISFGFNKASSSPIPSGGSQAPKVSVSFSFAKKAPVKLETAAAVFADHGEETVEGEEGQEEEGEKTGGEDAGVASTTDIPQAAAGGGGGESSGGEEEQSPPDDGGALASTLNKLKMMMEKEEGYSGQEPQYYHYVPPAHCRVKPHFQFLLFMKASDQCDSKEEEEDGAKDEKAATGNDGEQKHIKVSSCTSEKDTENEPPQAQNTNPTSATVRTEEESGSTPAGQGDTAVVDSSSQQTDTKQVMSEPTDTGPACQLGLSFLC